MKLEVFNNWENLSYYLNDKQIPITGKVKLTNGDVVNYINEQRVATVHDMGNSYEVVQNIHIAIINYSNSEIKVNLTELDIDCLII